MSGVFVTIDGPGGIGKSTATAAVALELRTIGVAVCQTREPSDTRWGCSRGTAPTRTGVWQWRA